MRIRKHVFYEPVSPGALRIRQAVEQTIALRVFDQVIQVTLFLVTKRLTITDEKLKVACIRLIDPWIVNLIDDAMAQCEPETTTGMISRAHALFRARSPARLDSRRTKRHQILRCIQDCTFRHALAVKRRSKFEERSRLADWFERTDDLQISAVIERLKLPEVPLFPQPNMPLVYANRDYLDIKTLHSQ